jgi:nitroreductase
MDAIFRRRSVRRFKQQDVPDGLIRKILSAGMNAPSAGNEQPWQFIVIKKKETLRIIAECSPYARAAAEAPLAVIVCGDLSLERHPGYWIQDCSAAVENMLLEAVELGLGAVWLGVYPLPDRVAFLKKSFSLPDHIVPLAIIPVGYPGQDMPAVDRYDQARVHNEQW